MAEMRERTPHKEQLQARTPEQTARQAVTYARDHLFEKDAVQDRRAIYETALNRGMGEITYTYTQPTCGSPCGARAQPTGLGQGARSQLSDHRLYGARGVQPEFGTCTSNLRVL